MDMEEQGLQGEFSEGRFVCLLKCDFRFCGEIVTVAGTYSMHEHVEWPDGGEPESFENYSYHLRSVRPAPHMISTPDKLNDQSARHLIKAYELFWVDYGSCANGLRIVVEHLLDQLGIARTGEKGRRKNARLDLSDRINLLATAWPGHEDALTALRHVGNLGSHEGAGTFEDILDCFELLEDAMIELVDARRERLAAKAKEIVARRGKPATVDLSNWVGR
ncbi:DUF4145 domain-containing protein [Neorhizobium sp. DAR64872/K0K18]|uniref:DUF4145 domain-containing protein n=1 Tax=Neorhizobium sp. DAR64872/K0K18 TaxID=3421958 RepID=UPI003D269271